MFLTKRKLKLAAYLRKLGYDAKVRKNHITVPGSVNLTDIGPLDDIEVIRKATETTIIPREIQAPAATV
jgi:hypothetical protein